MQFIETDDFTNIFPFVYCELWLLQETSLLHIYINKLFYSFSRTSKYTLKEKDFFIRSYNATSRNLLGICIINVNLII